MLDADPELNKIVPVVVEAGYDIRDVIRAVLDSRISSRCRPGLRRTS